MFGGAAPASVEARAMPFVGRRDELRTLRSALAEVTGGRRGMLVLVGGEPGIGKTRLAEELATAASAGGLAVRWASCWEGAGDAGSGLGLSPWVQLVRAHLRERGPLAVRAELAGDAAEVGRLLPELAPPGTPETGLDPPGEPARLRLFDCLAAFLRRAAGERPMVLVVEDLHRADPSSLLFLRFLAGELSSAPILVIGTHRDGDDRRPLDHLGGLTGPLLRLRLAGLGPDDVADLAASITGAVPEPDRVAALHRRTGGNPYFVRELLWLAGSGLRLEGAVPDGVRAVIGHRLSALSDDCRDLLAAGAVLGSEFDLDVAAEVAGLPAGRAAGMAAEAASAGLLEARPAVHRFVHALVPEVLDGGLAVPARQDLHRRAAAALEERHREELDAWSSRLAHHHAAAGPAADVGAAVPHLRRAAAVALRRHAYDEAAEHLRRELELLELAAPADRRRRGEVLLGLGEALTAAGGGSAAARALDAAVQAARDAGDAELLARAALAMDGGISGTPDQRAAGAIEEALRRLPPGDHPLRARLLCRMARTLLFAPEPERRAALAEAATAMARRLGDPAVLAVVLFERHQVLWSPAGPAARLATAAELLDRADRAGSPALRLRVMAFRLGDLMELGEVERLRVAFDEYAAAIEQRRQVRDAWHVPLQRASVAMLAGRFEEAERLAGDALRLGRRVEHPSVGPAYATAIAVLRLLEGRLAEHVDVLRGLADALPALPAFRVGLVLALCADGREAEARVTFEGLAAAGDLAPDDFLATFHLALLAVACHRLGDAATAARLEARLRPHANHNVRVLRIGVGCLGSARHHLGLLAATRGRWDEAVAHLEAAVAANGRQGLLPLAAASRRELGRALLARGGPGDAERGRRLLGEAEAVARSIGMRLDAGAAAPATAEDVASLRREGDYWTLAHGGREHRLRDAVGLGLLARLLAEPGREVHALDLAAPGAWSAPAAEAVPALDDRAREAYRRRLRDLAEEIEEAEAWGDPERASRARREVDALTDQLAAAVGLGGRCRPAASAAERARSSVTKAVRRAIDRVGEADEHLGAHLERGVRTGLFCSYSPDPSSAITWRVTV